LGQSAATAAAQAIDEDVPVQRVDGNRLRRRLLSDRQILEWKGQRRSSQPDPDSVRLSRSTGDHVGIYSRATQR
jgi:hypothetical protein